MNVIEVLYHTQHSSIINMVHHVYCEITMKTIEEIKVLINSGKVDESIEELHSILNVEPENVEAEMLLGTCCQLKGDGMTFNAVYEAVRPQMEIREQSGEQSSAVSLWKRYKKLWLMLFASTCLLGGL